MNSSVGGRLTYETKLDTSGYQKGINNIANTTKKAGSTIKNIVVGLGITKLISASISTIRNSVDDAVSRFDTLNNFPKVMSNLGISSQQAEKSIKKMSDKLAGLPTTLDQGAQAVQRFTSKNNDVEKSTDIFLALNNAIIAGGAPTEQQASAMEQLSQAYAKGKPDMMEWRTAMAAMPAQLKQVAEAMGYVNADELGEALRKGEVSMDDFMDTIVRLNKEGINGLDNFEKQARNATDGITTALTVAKTQIVKGVADIIEALDVKLEKLGIGKLGDVIAKAGKKAKSGLDEIAKLIKGEISVKKFTDNILKTITNFFNKISEYIPVATKKALEIIQALLKSFQDNAPQLIQAGIDIIVNLINGLAEGAPMLIEEIVKTILILVETILDNIDKIVDAGIKLMYGLADGIIQALPEIIDKAPIIIEKLLLAFADNLPKLVEMGIMLNVKLGIGFVKAIPTLIAHVPELIYRLLNAITTFVGKFIETGALLVLKLLEGIASVLARVAVAGANIVINLISGISSRFGELASTISTAVKIVIDAIKDLPSKAFEYGKDMILGFIKGMKSKFDALKKTAIQGAINITKIFHFSRPDEGPLREYETWMPDMIKGFAYTMEKSSNILKKQSAKLAQSIKDQLNIDYLDEVYDKFNSNVMIQTGKMAFSGTAGSINEILTATGTTTVVNENKLLLDGDVVYENQKKVSARKNLQTQFGGAYNVSN